MNRYFTIAAKQRELYKMHYKRLYNTCLRIMANPMEAEEATHDAFLKLFAKIDEIKDEAKFYGWSRSIAVNTAIDSVRRKKIVFESVEKLSIVEEEPIDEEELQLSVDKIKKNLMYLPDGYRIVLSMHLFEDYDFKEIAKLLNLKEASVRSQYSRGRQKLITMMDKGEG
jgi:RNA polymerase sigma-70 factor (ECF subfamily)